MGVVAVLTTAERTCGTVDAALRLAEALSSDLDIVAPNLETLHLSPLHPPHMLGPESSTHAVRVHSFGVAASLLAGQPVASTVLVIGSKAPVDRSPMIEAALAWRGPTLIVPSRLDAQARLLIRQMMALSIDELGFGQIEPWIRSIALRTASRLTLFSVLDPNTSGDGDLELQFTRARSTLQREADGLRQAKVRVAWELRLGELEDEITRLAETTNSSLIFLPSNSLGAGNQLAAHALANRSRTCVFTGRNNPPHHSSREGRMEKT